jgi:hypothetical protein
MKDAEIAVVVTRLDIQLTYLSATALQTISVREKMGVAV